MQVLRPPSAAKKLGVSLPTLWRIRKDDPTFPLPFRLGQSSKSAVGFLEHEIDAWLKSRADKSRLVEKELP